MVNSDAAYMLVKHEADRAAILDMVKPKIESFDLTAPKTLRSVGRSLMSYTPLCYVKNEVHKE